MWNTNFVVPSLLVLSTLLVYYFVRPRLPGRINRAFLHLILWIIGRLRTPKSERPVQPPAQGITA